ncbi:MAG: hypothetical protein ACJAQ3_002906 [Planctomycetota bacterium]|jgi:hypothetical protein
MPKDERPHFAWTAAVIAAASILAVTAWWLWSRPDAAPVDGSDAPGGAAGSVPEGGSSEPAEDPGEAREEGLRAALARASKAMDDGRFREAAEVIDSAEDRFGWSERLREVVTRLSMRESTYREALRPIEFRIENLITNRAEDESDELYARYSIEGVPVFASQLLETLADKGPTAAVVSTSRHHFAVLRTSFATGVTLEIVQPGGIFDSEDVVFGPIQFSPLPLTEGGSLVFADADSRLHSMTISYHPSRFEPGIHIDARPPQPPADATAARLVDAIMAAVGRDDLEMATTLHGRLSTQATSKRDVEFTASHIETRRDALRQNRTTATFTILELSVDPRPTDDQETKLWASGGSAPAFHASIRTTDGRVLESSGDEPTAPYLIPGSTDPAPEGNVLHVVARGDAPLVLVVKDSAPRFSSRVVGDIDLPVSLDDLPRGSGTIVIERSPRVLILPNSEPNRIRRLVLRWSVTR